jgi:hypothetical protein
MIRFTQNLCTIYSIGTTRLTRVKRITTKQKRQILYGNRGLFGMVWGGRGVYDLGPGFKSQVQMHDLVNWDFVHEVYDVLYNYIQLYCTECKRKINILFFLWCCWGDTPAYSICHLFFWYEYWPLSVFMHYAIQDTLQEKSFNLAGNYKVS